MAKRYERVLATIVICAALLVLPGCVVIDSRNPPSWLPTSLIPTTTPPAQQPAHPAAKDKKRADVWIAYFAKGGRLVGADRDGKPKQTSPEKALATLLAGPTAAEKKAGYVSAIPAGTKLRYAELDYGGTVRVNLSREFAAGSSGASVKLRVAQVVWTLTQLPGVGGVLIKIEGKPVQQFGKEKLDLMGPVTRTDFADVAPLP